MTTYLWNRENMTNEWDEESFTHVLTTECSSEIRLHCKCNVRSDECLEQTHIRVNHRPMNAWNRHTHTDTHTCQSQANECLEQTHTQTHTHTRVNHRPMIDCFSTVLACHLEHSVSYLLHCSCTQSFNAYLHSLPIEQRIKFKLATLIHNTLCSTQPAYLHSLLNYHTPTRSLRSANANLLSVPSVRTTFASRGFSVAAPAVLNSLPSGISDSSSTHTFHRLLKTHCFQQDFGSP